MKSRVFLLIFVLLLSLSLISASFTVGNISHELSSNYYGTEMPLLGWFNISLNEEPGDSLIIDNWGNSIELLDLLKSDSKLVQDSDYTCNLEGCLDDYNAINPSTAKAFSLTTNTDKIIGFKFTDDITRIDSVDFEIESNAGASCTDQLKIDIGDDSTIDKGNNKASSTACSSLKDNSCFDSSQTSKKYEIGYFPAKHCQKINLSAAPGFEIGAWIEKETDTREFKISIYTLQGSKVQEGSCILPTAPISGGEVSCNVDYILTEPKEHYVCIYSDGGTGTAKIRGYLDNENGCGFYGTGIKTENAAFDIFATPKKYSAVGTLEITNSISSGGTLANLFENYIDDKYGTLDCSSGCIVPMKFIPSTNQQVTLKNLQIKYSTTLGSSTENNFYTIDNIIAPKVSSDFIKISLDNSSFKTPSDLGNITLSLSIEDYQIFSQELSIEKVAIVKSLEPLQTSAAYPTTFKVEVEKGEANLTSYSWDFGDSLTGHTTEPTIQHTYNKIGIYDLEIIVSDKKGFTTSKTFQINVGSSKEIINLTLDKMEKNLENIKSKIATYSDFEQQSINNAINIDILEGELKRLDTEYNTKASKEEDYDLILSDLLKLNVPNSIYSSVEADSIPYSPESKNIDIDYLISAGGGDYGDRETYEYKDAIIKWGHENLDAKIDYKEISGSYGTESILLVNLFSITIDEKQSLTTVPYFIVQKAQDLIFEKDYLESQNENSYSIELQRSSETISFSTTENINFLDLEMFISPRISELVFTDDPEPPEPPEPPYNWLLLVMILVLILFIALGIYMWMQAWYKKKYERYLFKDKNNLYNLINYLHSSKSKGWSDSEIASRLRKSGWKREQVAYVMKKYAGRETGMAEIPINKIISRSRKKPLQPGKKMPDKYEFKRYKKL